MNMTSRYFSILAAGCLLLTTPDSWARFAAPQLVPIDRLLKTAEANVAKNAQDADAYYTLGRIHYLAFSMKRDSVPAFAGRGDESKISLAANWQREMVSDQNQSAELGKAALLTHADKALTNFNEALKLDPKNGVYALGLASLLDEFRTWDAAAKPEVVPAGLGKLTVEQVRAAYAKAFKLALVEDSKLPRMPIAGVRSIAANEAAEALVRLAKDAPASMTEEDKADLKAAEEAQAKFAKLPRGPMTPMVFSFEPKAHLDEMLDPTRIVDFDLRGYGPQGEKWTWVKPELGLLVWDPLESGEVKSAHQLFGGYTFQIFRKTGYDALSALDDNQDGVLSGAELEGISAWFDRNGDGRSTAAEVTPLRDLDVDSIAVTATTQDGRHPMNPRGLTLRTGRTLPTWDWITDPVGER
jgi:hypothetical protein